MENESTIDSKLIWRGKEVLPGQVWIVDGNSVLAEGVQPSWVNNEHMYRVEIVSLDDGRVTLLPFGRDLEIERDAPVARLAAYWAPARNFPSPRPMDTVLELDETSQDDEIVDAFAASSPAVVSSRCSDTVCWGIKKCNRSSQTLNFLILVTAEGHIIS